MDECSRLYAGNSEYPKVLEPVTPNRYVQLMVTSENPFGADNQQERPGIDEWIVGFTDGEGCFSIAIVRNRVCRLGWQVQHEFSVTQSASSLEALELIREFFGCGTIIPNRRRDNHNDLMLRFSVKRRTDLVQVVVPFFTDHPLRTAKRVDFSRFKLILDLMEEGRHLESDGLAEIATITETMNRRRRSRYLESSEAIRRPSHIDLR